MKKPFIHTMPIPGCENYNAEYFEKRNMSIKCKTVEEIIENTKMLLENPDKQKEMIENQEKNIKKDTCDKIANIIIG